MATKIATPIAYHDMATMGVTTDLIEPYKYQWMRNGVNLVHGNNKSYTTPPLKPADFSAKYSVTVYGQNAIETSAEVVIDANVKHVDPITNQSVAAKTGFLGVPVSKPFSDKPLPPKPFPVKP
jgi:hypothetical protein